MPEHANLDPVPTRRLLTIVIPLVLLAALASVAIPLGVVYVAAERYKHNRAAEARDQQAIADDVAAQLRARPDVLEASAEYRDVYVWDEDNFTMMMVTQPGADIMPTIEAARCLAWRTPLPLRVIGVQIKEQGETGVPRSFHLYSSNPEWATLNELCGPRPKPR